MELVVKGEKAKVSASVLAVADTDTKNKALMLMADALIENKNYIIEQNKIDLENAKLKGIKPAMLDRLTLDEKRIEGMAEGIRQIVALPDPIGEVVEQFTRPNGLDISKKRVPIGVVGIIYEARPNVTADAAALCIKSGNVPFLRGGSEALVSNMAIVKVMQDAIEKAGLPKDCIILLEDASREKANQMMKLNKYIDVLIPRGGAGLIKTVVENSTIPVIETGSGICHTYVSQYADIKMAADIVINAKVSRPSVCNAMETLLVDKNIAEKFLPVIVSELKTNNVEVRGCEKCKKITPDILDATDDDWATEYNDYILSIKIVEDLNEAVTHIAKYGTKHSEAIVTDNREEGLKFTNIVDAAAVYINASTRFTDGFEFGLGAEIGISTQKIHARGPMGLKELTTVKYVISGNGQVRK